ncbi:hypothetical protein QBC32DRAFT_271449, partial [Pseudoneurospora amorphoporcata]
GSGTSQNPLLCRPSSSLYHQLYIAGDPLQLQIAGSLNIIIPIIFVIHLISSRPPRTIHSPAELSRPNNLITTQH